MPSENLEIVRVIYAGWERGNFASAEWADDEIEYMPPDSDTPSRGREAMASRWREFLSAWSDFAAVPEEFIDLGDRVLVNTSFRGRGRGSGTPVTGFPGASLFTLRDGKVIRLFLYSSVQEAMVAAGIEDQ